MLLNLREYHRPGRDGQDIGRALELLARPDIRTVPLAGGNTVIASADPTIQAVVDLQDLGLDIIREDAAIGELSIGAMATRSALAESAGMAQCCSGIIAEGARSWSGSAQRNRATIGGAVAVAATNDPLVAALLACDAVISVQDLTGTQRVPMAEFLLERHNLLASPALVTEVCILLPRISQHGAICRVGRTPADTPIVLAAVSLSLRDGQCAGARVVVGGVADTPVRVQRAEQILLAGGMSSQAIGSAGAATRQAVSPADDFRGTASYRREMAGVLVERALHETLSQSRAD